MLVNYRKIIRETIDDFEWAKDITPTPFNHDYIYVSLNRRIRPERVKDLVDMAIESGVKEPPEYNQTSWEYVSNKTGMAGYGMIIYRDHTGTKRIGFYRGGHTALLNRVGDEKFNDYIMYQYTDLLPYISSRYPLIESEFDWAKEEPKYVRPTADNLKVGSIVRIKPYSRFHSRNTEDNPIGVNGTVREITHGGIWNSIVVQWDNGHTNDYTPTDLQVLVTWT